MKNKRQEFIWIDLGACIYPTLIAFNHSHIKSATMGGHLMTKKAGFPQVVFDFVNNVVINRCDHQIIYSYGNDCKPFSVVFVEYCCIRFGFCKTYLAHSSRQTFIPCSSRLFESVHCFFQLEDMLIALLNISGRLSHIYWLF